MTPALTSYAPGQKLRLLKDIWDDGEDHHPPEYCANKGEIVIVRSVNPTTLSVSHEPIQTRSFLVYPGEFERVARQTLLSPCRTYRYQLWREWDMLNPRYLMVIGLNPSTADETADDPTIRRCIDFARRWGYGALCMTNLFAFRATDPAVMLKAADAVGPDNDQHLVECAAESSQILAAWGSEGTHQRRDQAVLNLLAKEVQCLGTNKNGTPKHPLYLAAKTQPGIYSPT